MRKPLISILVCTYNRAHLVGETMASIFAQQYQPVEVIVVDDGSTDATPDLMAQYGERIRYHRQTNQGIAVTRTRACALATGEYIAFQDDDDLMIADRINVLFDALCAHPTAVLAVGDWEAIDEVGASTGQRWRPAPGDGDSRTKLITNGHEAVLWSTLAAVPHTTLFRRTDGEKIGWFDSAFRYGSEDKDFFARLALLGPIAHVPKVVSQYRQSPATLSRNSLRSEYGRILLSRKHLALLTPGQHAFARRLRSRMLWALERMAIDQQTGATLPDDIPGDYRREGWRLLGAADRLHYLWHTQIRARIRRLVHRFIPRAALN